MQKIGINLHTDYRQCFILATDEQDNAMTAIVLITDEDLSRKIKAENGIVALYTARGGCSRIAIEIHDHEPSLDLNDWEHVVEAGLDVQSDSIFICNCISNAGAVSIQVKPGSYGLRFHSAALTSVDDPDATYGDDHYLVTLWPSDPRDIVVLKQYVYTERKGPQAGPGPVSYVN